MCQVSTNCELLMYVYLINCLFIYYMLWSRDVSNILEYKPSLKLLTINKNKRILYIAGKKYCQLRDSSVEGSRVLGN